jgi:hypothetical protein
MLKKRIGLLVATGAALAAMALVVPLNASADLLEVKPGAPLSFTLTSGEASSRRTPGKGSPACPT